VEREDTVVEIVDCVAWVTLNRPEVRNALTIDQRLYLMTLFERFSSDVGVRAVVLTGTGDCFCSGADLRAVEPPADRGGDVPERIIGDMRRRVQYGAQRLVTAILDCEKPVIAAVNGPVAGMGVQVALACDLVLAADSARFLEIFVVRGLVPDAGAAYLLSRLIGPQKTKELLFFGQPVSAERALHLGLVNAVVPASSLVATAGEWAARLADGPTRAIALSKWLVNRSLDTDRTGSLDDEATAVELNALSHDAQEGLAAFAQRRSAAFLGW
jgi:2-(1,2-epoxy-1,2-dihydrophenyl)acetyl-CoA isomerase